ncbi:MAG: alpha/beta hydrolase [Puniceicoccales bacterium]
MAIEYTTNPKPDLDYYAPSGAVDRKSALVVFPGGGYAGRAEHEGKGYAEFFAGEGFHVFVCHYRVVPREPRLDPAPLEDALYAVSTVRSRAEELGFSQDSVGVIGSSAGGHLAANVSAVSKRWGDEYRPDWTILCYPVIALFGPAAHMGSRNNLLGGEEDDNIAAQHSPQIQVDRDTPPAFLWHTLEDGGVPMENSLLYADALRRAGVPFELHVSEKGGHGLGLGADFGWAERAVQWLELTGRVSAA